MTAAALLPMWPAAAGALDFELPAGLEASAPPEERGSGRDDVRLMVARRSSRSVEHRRFPDLPDLLRAGDLLVVNTSATIPAALRAQVGHLPALLHLSTPGDAATWVVELRHPDPDSGGSGPWLDAQSGTVITLPGRGRATLLRPATPDAGEHRVRLWEVELHLPAPLDQYLATNGRPIRYRYVDRDRPLSAYQTVFAEVPGSAEMPSAARPFTTELVTRLVSRGVGVAPVVLHCGVSSQEAHETPMPERFRVPADTAARVNVVRRLGGRIVAVGTTAVRAIETAANRQGLVLPAAGWTDVVIGPEQPVRVVDGMVTGWHEARASHLAMIEAVAGRELLEASYRAALENRYLWHEFGDSHLILP